MSFNRRGLLGGLAVGGAASVALASGPASAAPKGGLVKPPRQPDLVKGPLVDRDRATEIMQRDGVSGLIVADPINLYYLTGLEITQFMRSLVLSGLAFGLVPRDRTQPVGIVLNSFGLYYSYAPVMPERGVAVFQYTPEHAPDVGNTSSTAGVITSGTRLAAGQLAVLPDGHEVRDRPLEIGRRTKTEAQAAAWGVATSANEAMGKAARALNMATGRIGCDFPEGSPQWRQLEQVLNGVTLQDAEPTISRIRLVKSPEEIAFMRYAALANAAAATEASRAVRAGANSRELRQTFYAEAAKRGGLGAWIAIDGVAADAYCEDFRRGQTFMIDAVSTYNGYHGDFGRTVFVGDPRNRMRAHAEAIQQAWAAVRERLRPGLRFSEIQAIGEQSLKKARVETSVRIVPHSVGVLHTDAFGIGDIALEPGMIISVDFPVLETGIGGSAHLEDLTLITRDGHELLNAASHPTITV